MWRTLRPAAARGVRIRPDARRNVTAPAELSFWRSLKVSEINVSAGELSTGSGTLSATMGSLLGYARVSTGDQDLALQLDALHAAGCERVFSDTASGALGERPELARVLDHLRAGDTLVVWRLDRLGRSLRHLVDVVGNLAERQVGFHSLHDAIDTTSSSGRFVFHIFAALAELERELIRERTHAGLAAARARGRHGGRPTVMTPTKTKVAREMYASGDHTVSAIAQTLGVGRATIYRHLEPAKELPSPTAVEAVRS